ncbi:MAG: hypothetical protein HUJ56_11645, partial [Erysipelotrichaceae bacterium]|nr:hypothetical protein [Erysipelotrichaceae bacterium]
KDKEEKLEKLSGESAKREKAQEVINGLKTQIDSVNGILDKIVAELGGSIPSAKAIESAKDNKTNAETLSAQLKELDSKYVELDNEYKAIMHTYGNQMPTQLQLDAIQNLYGELQGLSSSKEESVDSIPLPEQYDAITKAIESDETYLNKLSEVTASQSHLEALSKKLSKEESDIQYDNKVWLDRKNRYSALHKDEVQLKSQLNEKYNPLNVKGAISSLEKIQKAYTDASRQKEITEKNIVSEEKNWVEKRNTFANLKEEVETCQSQLKDKEKYAGEKTNPAIKKLEKLQKDAHSAEVYLDDYKRNALSDSEEALIRDYSGALPDRNDCNKVIDQIRNKKNLESQVQGLESRVEGENSKKQSIALSMAQLGDIPVVEEMDEPNKPMSALFIGLGILIMVIGAALAVFVNPVLAVLSVIGIVFAFIGITGNSKYKTAVERYEENGIALQKRDQVVQQKGELQFQLDKSEEQLAQFDNEMSILQKNINDCNYIIDNWASKWLSPGTDVNEEAVRSVITQVDNILKLRGKKAELEKKKANIDQIEATIVKGRNEVEKDYPEIKDLSIEEALTTLRAASTDYRVLKGNLDLAVKNYNNFIKREK